MRPLPLMRFYTLLSECNDPKLERAHQNSISRINPSKPHNYHSVLPGFRSVI
jgi:hypothetical protein